MALKLAMLPAPKAAVGRAQKTSSTRHGSQKELGSNLSDMLLGCVLVYLLKSVYQFNGV
jgi:hypothetical protein